MNTTLNNIRKHNPCKNSWEKLLASLNKTQSDDEALPLRNILDTLGVVDAIWALRSLEGADREIRLFACDCAERVLPIYEAKYPNDTLPRNAIEVSRKYANGDATKEELDAAFDAARGAARAVSGAARRASGAALAAALAASDAAMAAAGVAWAGAAMAAALAASDAAMAAALAASDAAMAAAEREAQRGIFIKYFC